MIAIIRSSDDTAHARARLMEVLELTEIQTNYILEMPLRRLTRFSRIELETEQNTLQTTITELTEILDSPEQLRTLVGNDLAEVARVHGTPRRTILLAASGAATTPAAAPLEVADDPCWVLLSSAGLLARTDHADPLPAGGPRAAHDVIVSAITTTARADCGLLTSTGRLIRINALDLPTVPATANAPNLQGGTQVSELINLERDERVLGLTTLAADSLGLALGTADGVVKRVNPEVLGKDSWEVIRLEAGDRVVGAVELTSLTDELVFVSNDAQLLHFAAAGVRPQGRAGGGMAGIKLAVGAKAVFFGAVPTAGSVVVTVSGTSRALPGTDAGSIKVTAVRRVPGQGPGHRRGPLSPVPQGRGHPAAGLGGARPRVRRRGQRGADRAARGGRSARRIGYAGGPADRRRRLPPLTLRASGREGAGSVWTTKARTAPKERISTSTAKSGRSSAGGRQKPKRPTGREQQGLTKARRPENGSRPRLAQ